MDLENEVYVAIRHSILSMLIAFYQFGQTPYFIAAVFDNEEVITFCISKGMKKESFDKVCNG